MSNRAINLSELTVLIFLASLTIGFLCGLFLAVFILR